MGRQQAEEKTQQACKKSGCKVNIKYVQLSDGIKMSDEGRKGGINDDERKIIEGIRSAIR